MDTTTAQQLAADGLDAEHWAALQRGEFRLPQCRSCSRWTWPVQPRCGTCGHFGFEWAETPMDGVIYTWTRTCYPFVAERAGALPYVTVLVELPAAGNTRVLGIFDGDDANVVTGTRVTGRIAPPSVATFGLPSVTWS